MSPVDVDGTAGETNSSSWRASRWRVVLAFAIVGLLLGFGWGIADQPIYTATASVAVASDSQGSDVARLERFAQRGESRQVAAEAAGSLGGDVAGADLLAAVSMRPAEVGGAVIVTAESETPDFAAAAADGFAEALVKVEGDPLELGASASIPSSPTDNRPAGLCAAVGLLVGALIGAAGAFAWGRSRRGGSTGPPTDAPTTEAPPDPESVEIVDLHVIGDLLATGDGSAPGSVVVTPIGGGEGASRTAIELAESAARSGRRVLLVDADFSSPRLARLLELEPEPGLVEYLSGEAAPRDVLRTVHPDSGARGDWELTFACVPGGRPRADESIAGPGFAGLVARLSRAYELVLYAAPPLLEGDDAGIVVGLVEGAVLVAAAGVSQPDLAEAIELLDSTRVLGVVAPAESD